MRRLFMVLVSMAFMTFMLLAKGVPLVEATVEVGWPNDTPNECRNTDDFFLDFEAGIDAIEIESTIPSMEFTTTGELNWIYGDITTENYNVYPYNNQAYDTNGNFFAWLGTLGDQGRIDFLGGGASYCSVLVSTSSGLILDAYDSDDTLIATSGWAGSNINTRTFTRLTVEAPVDETIAYIMIHDTGNFWLIDDLCTDANKAVVPVPTRDIGSDTDRFDVIFVPDEDYGTPADIDTWLPGFISDIQDQIDLRLDAAAPVTGNLDSFNFYYTRVQGDSVYPNHNLPADITRVVPWADAYVILHNALFDDWTLRTPNRFSAEGFITRSFIHESGHGIFGLADEYDDAPGCRTRRFEPDPFPNVWDDEADCRADVTNEGWGDPDDCWEFTTCTTDWWKFTTTSFIMQDGTFFANGWGQPASRRIQWVLDNNPGTAPAPAGPSGEEGKSIWLNMQVSDGVFSLLEESYVVANPPSNRSDGDTFMIKVTSNGNAGLDYWGMHDPRIVLAEPGTERSTWRDSANFQVIVPYFASGEKVDIIETSTGNIKLSVDISQYATALAPVAICQDINVELNINGEAFISANDIDNGSYDPDGDPITFSLDKSYFTCADLGGNSVVLTVTDDQGNPGACTATVNVIDTIPPIITCPSDTTIECDESSDPANTGYATATDACDPSPTITYSDVTLPGSCPEESTITRTWTATDASGNSSSCSQIVEVVDTTPPEIECNAPLTVSPVDTPISFTATATDSCAADPSVEIVGYDCFFFTKKGKKIDRTNSCIVQANEDTFTIEDSGGIDDNITWNVRSTDNCGNVAESTCSIIVQKFQP